MRDDGEAKVMRIANDIKRYLDDHPNAADTLDGITWWFLRQRFAESTVLVQQALDYLVAESLVERKSKLGSGHLYFSAQRPGRDEK